MNRSEALRILGLGDDASREDIRTAYRESAQILHPDRFANNKKLQERATEQFKNLQEAYELLMGKRGRSDAGGSSGSAARRSGAGLDEAREIEARLVGIAAARVQLVAQRDMLYDERRNGAAFLAIGGIVALLLWRRRAGLLMAVAGIASAVAVWGAVQIISVQRSISTLNGRLKELEDEKKRLLARLEELGS